MCEFREARKRDDAGQYEYILCARFKRVEIGVRVSGCVTKVIGCVDFGGIGIVNDCDVL